jgi:hypothetical protein
MAEHEQPPPPPPHFRERRAHPPWDAIGVLTVRVRQVIALEMRQLKFLLVTLCVLNLLTFVMLLVRGLR